MFMIEKTIVNLTDLCSLSIECSRCSTRIVLSVENMLAVGHQGVSPTSCPSCKHSLVALGHIIDRFLDVCRQAKNSENTLSFEIEQHG